MQCWSMWPDWAIWHQFEVLSEFSSGHICPCFEGLAHFDLEAKHLQMQTLFVLQIMHQYFCCCFTTKLVWQHRSQSSYKMWSAANLVNTRQCINVYYSKFSFIALVLSEETIMTKQPMPRHLNYQAHALFETVRNESGNKFVIPLCQVIS